MVYFRFLFHETSEILLLLLRFGILCSVLKLFAPSFLSYDESFPRTRRNRCSTLQRCDFCYATRGNFHWFRSYKFLELLVIQWINNNRFARSKYFCISCNFVLISATIYVLRSLDFPWRIFDLIRFLRSSSHDVAEFFQKLQFEKLNKTHTAQNIAERRHKYF